MCCKAISIQEVDYEGFPNSSEWSGGRNDLSKTASSDDWTCLREETLHFLRPMAMRRSSRSKRHLER